MSGVELIGGIAGIVSAVYIVGREVVSLINHKRIRSKCCDKEVSMSVDIENTKEVVSPKSSEIIEEVKSMPRGRSHSLADK